MSQEDYGVSLMENRMSQEDYGVSLMENRVSEEDYGVSLSMVSHNWIIECLNSIC